VLTQTPKPSPGAKSVVIRLSENLAVRYGLGVRKDCDQMTAYALLCPYLFRVPVSTDIFSMKTYTNLLQTTESVEPIDRIFWILSDFTRELPGPLSPGVSYDLLWGVYNEPRFNSLDDMEKWRHG